MKNLRATVAVGLLAIATVVLVVIGVAYSNRGISSGGDTYRLVAMFDDVTGIATGTKVTIAGYTVGQVDDIHLKGHQVRVTLLVRNLVVAYAGVTDPQSGNLRNAALLTRREASLLGDYYLELTPGAGGPILKDGDQIPIVVTATAMQATLQKLETAANIVPKIDKIAGDVALITDNAAKVLGSDQGAKRFEEIADNLVKASRELTLTTENLRHRLSEGTLAPGGDLDRGVRGFADTVAKINRMADGLSGQVTKGANSANRSLANIEVVTTTVRDIVGRNTGEFDSTVASVTALLKRLDGTLARLDRVVAEVETTTQHVAEGKGTVGRLLHDETLVRSAEEVMGDAKALLDRYTALEVGLDYRVAAYAERVQSAHQLAWQSHLSLRLQPRKDMYVLATLTSDNVGRTLTRVTTGTQGQEPLLTDTYLQEDTQFKFGVQYARRFGFVTLRGGLIESSAGGGMDVHAFADHVMLSADLFRFDENSRPRLRASLLVEFYKYLFAWAGGDELMYPSTRADLFYGLGVRFTDDDLKILFASAPSISTK